MTLAPATPPPIEVLSPDLQFKLWERERNRIKRSWFFALLLCSPAIGFIAVKPVNDTLTTIYRGASFLHWLTGLATLPQAGSGAATVPAGTAGLNEQQTAVAQEIIQAGIDRGLDRADIRLALMTAMQESTMQELEHGDDWHFQAMGWGERSDSVGAFQQRDSWGSRECRIDAKCSANLFYDALLQVSDRHSMPEWKAIAKVQRPAAQYEQHYQQWESQADEILKAVKASPVSAASGGRTVEFKGVQVTSARDATGEPGLDYVVSGGERGAEFGALAAGTVVKTVMEDWESHLEAGDTRRGYGSLVVVRVQDGQGNEIDMLYAHMDSIAVKEGDRIEVGTVIGTQGRKGSTTGPHVSVDFFAPGTRSANAASLAMRDRIAGILQSNPDALNQQIQSAPPAQLPPVTEIVSLAKVDLPKDLRLPSLPSLPGSKLENSVPGIQQPEGGMCGSVAIAPDRLITANHCIKSSEVTIVPASGEWLKGRVIKQSAEADLALIQVDGANFPVLSMGSSPQAGDEVRAIGYPTANGGRLTVTPSTVQAIGQSCGIQEKCFSVPSGVISPGFSGGATIDSQGRLVGVNRAIKETNGVGYMIPIDVVKEFAQ